MYYIIVVVVYNSTTLSLLFHCRRRRRRRRRVVSVHSRLSGVGAKTHVLPGPRGPPPRRRIARRPAGRRMRPTAPFEG